MGRENRREQGRQYERTAGRYLEMQGYRILEYNFRCRFAEIDIIAMDGEELVFCEVKSRDRSGTDSALEAVDIRKQRRISRAALCYLGLHRLAGVPCRFDVVGISGDRIRLCKNAFEYQGAEI